MALLVTVTGLLISGALLGMLGITLVNLATYRRLETPPGGSPAESPLPTVSVLIPARNEADRITPTLAALLNQHHAPLEILVLDDHSQDETRPVVEQMARGEPRLSVLAGRDLPKGWLGKNWACWQLAQVARGEVLIFTDADVHWEPGAVAAAVSEMARFQADMLAIWPTQVTGSWSERLVVPLMSLVILGYLPWKLVHDTPWPYLAAANGQAVLFRRRSYFALGGHAAVCGNVLEDVNLARRTKEAHMRLRMVEGNHLVRCRMYHNWQQVRDGYAKNILAGYGGSPGGLLAATLFHWLIFLGPWLWLATPATPGWPLWPALLILSGGLVRGLTAIATDQPALDALWMPISTLLMTAIAAQSLFWTWRYGGPLWKGRILHGKSRQ